MNAKSSRNASSEADDDLLSDLMDEVSLEMKEHLETANETDTDIVLREFDFATPICSIHELYSYQTQIGRGSTAKVFLAQSKQTHKQYALKQMLRSDHRNRSSFVNEVNILKQINHPNIIRLNDAYISKEHYYLTTEYGINGLMEKVKRLRLTKKRFSEMDAARCINNILKALEYIHAKNIVHRDLKLSNIVFDRNSTLKLIDFGQSEIITDYNKKDRNIFGSLCYLSPETLRTRKKRELFASDMWAVGIISYILLHGFYPYNGHDINSMMQSIQETKLKCHQVSDSCKDFIKSLLNKDVTKRLTAKDALQHDWILKQVKHENLESFKLRLQFMEGTEDYEESLSICIDKILDEIDDDEMNDILAEIIDNETLQNKQKDTVMFVPSDIGDRLSVARFIGN